VGSAEAGTGEGGEESGEDSEGERGVLKTGDQVIRARILMGYKHKQYCQATWWYLDGGWKCVGSMKGWSRWILGLSMDQAEQRLRQMKVEFKWVDKMVRVTVSEPKKSVGAGRVSEMFKTKPKTQNRAKRRLDKFKEKRWLKEQQHKSKPGFASY
jgi:hypothetical protein